MAEPNEPTTEHHVAPAVPIKPSGTSRLDFFAQTHPGRVRLTNEDHYFAARLSRTLETLDTSLPTGDVPKVAEIDAYIFAVADGVGGHVAGERASRLVIIEGVQSVLSSAYWALLLDNGESQRLRARIAAYFETMNEALRQAVENDPELDGMATTLSAVYVVGLRAFVVHIGDSRVYLQRDGALTQLTRDHTMAQRMVDAGLIEQSDVAHHPRKHVLTKVLAGRSDMGSPDVTDHELRPGDCLVISSDGLSDLVPAEQIGRLLAANPNPPDAVKALINAALDAGGRDNVTVIVVRVLPSKASSSENEQ